MLAPALRPGYRFSPTEVQLVAFYLKNKVLGQKITTVDEVIPEVDLYEFPPWDISEICLKSRHQHGYFFCRPTRKFANSSRKRRSTNIGQWKPTGKGKQIIHKSQTVGMKKTLVFYAREPLQGRTNWIIHEYSLCYQQPGDYGSSKDGYVLCKLFQKSNSYTNDDKLSAAEDWDDDDYSDNNAFSPSPSLTGSLGPDKICCSKDVMADKMSCLIDNPSFIFDCPGISSLEVTSLSSYSNKNIGHQYSSFAPEDNHGVGADCGLAAHPSCFHQMIPVVNMSSECDKDSLDLERTLLSCAADHIDGCSRHQENMFPMVGLLMNCVTDDNDAYSHQQVNISLKMHIKTLPPGFRFFPTEIELILFYLKNKVMGQKLSIVDQVMPEVDFYEYPPWDILEKCFKSRDQHGYFFCRPERKFAHSSRKRRSTNVGQWKITGNEKKIINKSQTVGTKTTLVFYVRDHLAGKRTNWVIHEYSLCNQRPCDFRASKNGFVLCKLFKKSDSDLKNDESLALEDWEYDIYSDNDALVPNSSLTRGSGPYQPCHSNDTMEESVPSVPDNTNFTFNCPEVSSQEATSHLESSSSHKSNGYLQSSFSLEEINEADANSDLAAYLTSLHQKVSYMDLYSECDEGPYDLASTPVNHLMNDIDGYSNPQESTTPVASSLMNCPTDNIYCPHQPDNITLKEVMCSQPQLTSELDSHGSSKDIFNILPIDELCPIDSLCYCGLDFDV